MPSVHSLTFPSLIQNIPVLEHSVRIEASNWLTNFAKCDLDALFTTIFAGQQTIRLSRDRLINHKYATPEQKCAEVVLWGYPNGMRGGRSLKVLNKISKIARLAPQSNLWPDYFNNLNALGDLGISTITKFAYFYSHTFTGFPALILDDQLIKNSPRWSETLIPNLSRDPRHYLSYLQTMHRAANALNLGSRPDKLEFFLFALGNSF